MREKFVVADVRQTSRRLLQPDQSAIWIDHGVLLASDVSGDESYGRVRKRDA